MKYEHVCLEAFGYTLPEEIVTSAQLEARLAPLYERLRLPEGRLELMTGIRERRFWTPGTLPSENSVRSAERAIRAAQIDRTEIGALVHASVCRDFLEPATACVVHERLKLPAECQVFDLSNACLGVLNGMLLVANMIELGQIRAGLVVASEGSRELVETTIATLNASQTLTRSTVKTAIASLTIGSASVAVVLSHRDASRTGAHLVGGIARAETKHVGLCHSSGGDEAVAGQMSPLMETDSEALMNAGVDVAEAAFEQFQRELGWQREELDKTVCHQVGSAQRKLLLATLDLPPETDFTSYEYLGNTGSAALPVTTAISAQRGLLAPGDQVGLFGIGSGINCVMLGARWQHVPVAGEGAEATSTSQIEQEETAWTAR
ncbi:MAG: 3-oxoacyl-ACP synthase III [Pirellulales bacterium]|nr:3-oxoacyl-ACP synthase III [Pirellulales bacterium]